MVEITDVASGENRDYVTFKVDGHECSAIFRNWGNSKVTVVEVNLNHPHALKEYIDVLEELFLESDLYNGSDEPDEEVSLGQDKSNVPLGFGLGSL